MGDMADSEFVDDESRWKPQFDEYYALCDRCKRIGDVDENAFIGDEDSLVRLSDVLSELKGIGRDLERPASDYMDFARKKTQIDTRLSEHGIAGVIKEFEKKYGIRQGAELERSTFEL